MPNLDQNPQDQNLRELRLIGLVAREYVRHMLDDENEQMFLRFDSLHQDILESCVNAVAEDSANRSKIDMRIPATLVRASQITDPSVLSEKSAAQARNTPSSKPLVLFANAQDTTIEDTLREIASIDEAKLKEVPEHWIHTLSEPEFFAANLPANSPFAPQLLAMFSAFLKEVKPSLLLGARYLLQTTELLLNGNPIRDAASQALVCLHLPRYIDAMPKEKQFSNNEAWNEAFSFILKEIPSEYFGNDQRPLSLSLETLQENLEKIQDDLTPSAKVLFTALAQNDPTHTWSELLQFDWESDLIKEFFTGKVQKAKARKLGDETLTFCGEHCNNKLSFPFNEGGFKTVEDFLNTFKDNDRIKKDEDYFLPLANRFLQITGDVLEQEDPYLLAKWEKLIYPTEIYCEDFLDGLLETSMQLARQIDTKNIKDPVLLVTYTQKTDDFFINTNRELLEYFATNYIGLESQCSDFIAFRFKTLDFRKIDGINPLFHPNEARDKLQKRFEQNNPTGKNPYKKVSTSTSTKALTLKFTVCIIERAELEEPAKRATSSNKALRLSWYFSPYSVAFGLGRDLRALLASKDPKSLFRVIAGQNFKQSNTKGLLADISLSNIESFGLTSSTFVDQNASKLHLDIKASFEKLLENPSSALAVPLSELKNTWAEFCACYEETIGAVLSYGYGSPAIPKLETCFNVLLEHTIEATASNFDLRRQLLSLLLSIGVFSFTDKRYYHAVVTPWNPVRLGALHRYYVMRAGLLKALLTHPKDTPAKFEWFSTQLKLQAERFEPHVVVAPETAVTEDLRPFQKLLSPVEHAFGYTLYSEVKGENCQNDYPRANADIDLLNAAENYLRLAPEATDCLKVWLPDVTDKTFPLTAMTTLAKKLPESERLTFTVGGAKNSKEGETAKKLFSGLLYATAQDNTIQENTFTTPEQSSRLRMQVITSSFVKGQTTGESRPWDLAFLDRYFTRNADIAWLTLPKLNAATNPYSLAAALQEDARRVMRPNEQHVSNTLLCPASVSPLGHTWLGAVREIMNVQSALGDEKTLFSYPAIRIDTNTNAVADDIKQIHQLAHWVVTCNNLLDRRQLLLQHDIDVVRYRHNVTTGRTFIVSCQMPREVISSKLAKHLTEEHSLLSKEGGDVAANCILDTVYGISGYVAMRAAKRDTAASEITGLALSHWINLAEAKRLCEKRNEQILLATSILVDDYAGILKNNSCLADLLTVVLAQREGRLQLHIFVSEAKFRLAGKGSCKHSAEQAASTATLILKALASSSNDAALRPYWHAFFANLVMAVRTVEIVDTTICTDANKLVQYAQQIRHGDFDLSINAVSHVFIPDEDQTVERMNVDYDDISVHQIVFYRKQIADLLRAKTTSPEAVANAPERTFERVLERTLASAENDDGELELNLAQPTAPWPWLEGISLDFLECAVKKAPTDPDDPNDPKNPKDLPPQGTTFCAPATIETTNVGVLLPNDDVDSSVTSVMENVVSPPSSPTDNDASSEEDRRPSPKDAHLIADADAPLVMNDMLSSDKASETREAQTTATTPLVTMPLEETPELHISTISASQVFSPAFEKKVHTLGAEFSYSPERTAWAKDAVNRLGNFLVAKGIQARLLDHKVTPNGCLASFKGDERLNTREMDRYHEALLTTESINVLFSIAAPGKFCVLFNDGSDKRETVPLWSAWSHQQVERLGDLNLSFVIGLKESDGNLLMLNPLKADPHTLIAGDTGSGKTALVQALLLNMAATNPSNLLKILLIDPKRGVDYRPLYALPHLLQPIVTDTAAIAGTIEALIDEMERRYALFEQLGVNKLTNFNEKVAPEERLPVLFVVHDEVPSCMQDPDYKDTVPSLITKLATKSRAAGIFLILIAQRPDHRVLDSQIRDNLGNRLVLKLPANTSAFALGEPGAENLLGHGHMAARIAGKVEYAQVPFLSDKNEVLEALAKDIRSADSAWQVPSAGIPDLEAALKSEHA